MNVAYTCRLFTLFLFLVFSVQSAAAALLCDSATKAAVPPGSENIAVDSRAVETDESQHRPAFYPPLARRLNEQGEVKLKLTVMPDGSVMDVCIVSSSGFADLDAAALEHAKTSHWKPALKGGVPVAGPAQINISFSLAGPNPGTPQRHLELSTQFEMLASDYPAEALAAKEEGVAALEILVAGNGGVVGVSVVHSSGSAALDKASEELAAKRWKYQPLVVNGQAAKSLALVAFIWRLPKSN